MANKVFYSDGSTKPYLVKGSNVHISLQGAFGSGVVAVEQVIDGTAYPLLNEGVAITHSVADDTRYNLSKGDIVQLTLSGSTNPALVWNITGTKG